MRAFGVANRQLVFSFFRADMGTNCPAAVTSRASTPGEDICGLRHAASGMPKNCVQRANPTGCRMPPQVDTERESCTRVSTSSSHEQLYREHCCRHLLGSLRERKPRTSGSAGVFEPRQRPWTPTSQSHWPPQEKVARLRSATRPAMLPSEGDGIGGTAGSGAAALDDDGREVVPISESMRSRRAIRSSSGMSSIGR